MPPKGKKKDAVRSLREKDRLIKAEQAKSRTELGKGARTFSVLRKLFKKNRKAKKPNG